MATPRLSVLFAGICKSANDIYSPALRSARAAQRIRAFHPERRLHQEHLPHQRYGSANEPPSYLGEGRPLGLPTQAPEGEAKALPKIGEKLQESGEREVKADIEGEAAKPNVNPPQKEPTTVDSSIPMMPAIDPILDSAESMPAEAAPAAIPMLDGKPMDSVLSTVPHPLQKDDPPPTDQHAEDHPDRTFDEHAPPLRAPHIEPPRYVHHFDTYGLVKRLVDGGWNEEKAITVMKAVRLMLADNTDLAKEALVSKSNLENEAYLFKAACAELKTEVTTRRKSEQEKMRTERGQLQHEVDILNQRLSQETATLKDELKGMFDDRKMAVRNEQRNMESKVQQLNYAITISLQADAKSEIEGLRWIMTRRVILTLGIIVAMVVGSLKLFSTAVHEEEEAAKRRANMKSGGTQTDEHVGKVEMREDIVLKDGSNAGLVSLG